MRSFIKIWSMSVGTLLSFVASATPDLNQIDALQQQRQRQQDAQHAQQLKTQPDVRLEIARDKTDQFPVNEKPCFDIYKISLLDYSSDNRHKPSQFRLELTKTARNLDLKLPLCIGPKGVNSIVKQIQNRIIDRGYVTTRVVAPEQDLTGGELTLIVKLNQKRI